ncbi:DUF6404 family protein [Klebsiella oxytoca]
MDFEVRKQKALAIMVRHNMFKCNYAPPLIRFLWWLGVKFPAAVCFVLAGFRVDGRQFLRNVRAVDVSYGLASTGMSPLFACAVSLITSVLFGLTMAFFYLWLRRVHKLPDWKDL